MPTKQNILCNRKSIRAVINEKLESLTATTATAASASTNTSSTPSPANISAKIRDPASFTVQETGKVTMSSQFELPPLNFHFQLPVRQRFVIVLERTGSMGLHSRWAMLHSELFRFVSLLPDAAELAIVTFGTEAELVLAPTLLTQENREGIYGRIPRRHLEDETSCIKCAVDLGLKTLGTASITDVNGLGGTMILITASAAKPSSFEDTLKLAQATNNQIHVVAFEKSIFYEARHLVGETGTTFIVHEKHHDVIGGALNISDIFTSILRRTGKMEIEKFHEEQKISDETSTVTGTFVVEENLRDNLWVQIAAPDEDDIEMFELTNPAGRVFEFPKYEHGLVYFKLAGTQEAGIWSYRTRLFKKDQNIRVSVQVHAQPSHKDSFALDTWTNIDHEGVNALQTPVKIFARLTSHAAPVMDAEVVATIHRPYGAEPVTVVLRDAGTGYPDITAGDGIYSAYFTQFTSEPGFYTVTVTATNKNGTARLPRVQKNVNSTANSTEACCGSAMTFSFTVPVSQFTRHSLAGSFFVKEGSQFYLRQGSPTRNDVFPPSRVTDFSLANYIDNSLYVTLKWTAPGNDYDFGQAFRYEIRCYTNREALREENFAEMGILVHTSLIPVPEIYGTEQRSTVGIPWPNEVFYYAIVAFDEEGNRGLVSNIVSVFAEEKPSTSSESFIAENIIPDEHYPIHISQPLTSENKDTLIYIVSGVISAILVVILILLLAAIYRSSWSKNIKRSNSSQIYVKDCEAGSENGKGQLVVNNAGSSTNWKDTDSCDKNSTRKSPIPSISDNLSWRYDQSLAGVHNKTMTSTLTSTRPSSIQKNHHYASNMMMTNSSTNSSTSTDSSMYSNDSETTVSAADYSLVAPRISVMEDYTVYRDLSHLDSMTGQEYFSFSQLPKELQGVSIVPYSPGYDMVEPSNRRHVSLV